jgi:cobalt-zinc-cadmium efflux system protein
MAHGDTHSHTHSSPHSHGHSHGKPDNIRLAFFLNLSFTLLEIVGGLFTNSVAILSDAVHDLGDSLSLGLAWFLERYAGRESDAKYSYGYHRFSLLGALINSSILLVGSALILFRTVPRLFSPEPANETGMIVLAVIGIIVNGIGVVRLRGDKSINARVIGLHLLEDVLGWTAVLIVGIVLLFTDWYILDPLLSILITAWIVYNVVRNLRDTLSVFLQRVPRDLDLSDIEKRMRKVENVVDTHHTHIWSLDGEHHVLSSHVIVAPETTRQQAICVKGDIKAMLQEYHLDHLTLDIEYGDADCAMD